jgi:hypothetical protein
VVLLVLLVTFVISTSTSATLGYQLVFGSFPVSVVSALLSSIPYLLRENATWNTTLFVGGGSLTVGAVVLYVRFGCVFGCPG